MHEAVRTTAAEIGGLLIVIGIAGAVALALLGFTTVLAYFGDRTAT